MPRCITAPSEQYKLALAVSMGGMLELYDFLIYALMASYLADNFFPASDQVTSLLVTFATFAVGYLSRPLGGLFFGHLGDRLGRKKTFTLTISLMALTTALMGCLPTYHQVGILAPILLVLCRLFQGFSLGGELPGAITYLGESATTTTGYDDWYSVSGSDGGYLIRHICSWTAESGIRPGDDGQLGVASSFLDWRSSRTAQLSDSQAI